MKIFGSINRYLYSPIDYDLVRLIEGILANSLRAFVFSVWLTRNPVALQFRESLQSTMNHLYLMLMSIQMYQQCHYGDKTFSNIPGVGVADSAASTLSQTNASFVFS